VEWISGDYSRQTDFLGFSFDLEIYGPGTGQVLNDAVNIVHLMKRHKSSHHFFDAGERDAFANAVVRTRSGDCYLAGGIAGGVESLD
jgi:hypothetical protein